MSTVPAGCSGFLTPLTQVPTHPLCRTLSFAPFMETCEPFPSSWDRRSEPVQ